MKRLLLLFLLLPAAMQGQPLPQVRPSKLWLGLDIGLALHSGQNTEHAIGGFTLEQELPYRLSVMTGLRISQYSQTIGMSDFDPENQERNYNGLELSADYFHVPLLMRWQLPLVRHRVGTENRTLYLMPHAGIDLNFGRDGTGYIEQQGTLLTEEALEIHSHPRQFFVDGNIGLAPGYDFQVGRLEPFTAYTLHGGRMIDISLREPHPKTRKYVGINMLHVGVRYNILLVDWRLTAADRTANRQHRLEQKNKTKAIRAARRNQQKS